MWITEGFTDSSDVFVQALYRTTQPFDPEGVLGTINSVVMGFMGMQVKLVRLCMYVCMYIYTVCINVSIYCMCEWMLGIMYCKLTLFKGSADLPFFIQSNVILMQYTFLSNSANCPSRALVVCSVCALEKTLISSNLLTLHSTPCAQSGQVMAGSVRPARAVWWSHLMSTVRVVQGRLQPSTANYNYKM